MAVAGALGLLGTLPLAFQGGQMSNFLKLGIRQSLVSALEDLGIVTPTWIQDAAVPKMLLNPKTPLLVAAPTGTGKTLTYLAPAVERIKRSEDVDGGAYRMTLPGRPKTLILVPTRELGEQVLAVAKSLSHRVGFKSQALLGHKPRSWMNRAVKSPIDLLVGTPGTIVDFHEHSLRRLFFSQLTEVIFDEADVMLEGKGFGDHLLMIEKMLEHTNARLVYVAATVPSKMVPKLKKRHKRLEVVKQADTYKAKKDGLRVEFVRVMKNAAKLTELRKVIELGKKTLVFCNTGTSCEFVARSIEDMGHPCAILYGDLRRSERSQNWLRFKNGFVNTIVCTDIASRGLDDPGIEMVFMFALPQSSTDYLHRVGRIRGNGKVVVLTTKYEIDFARGLFLAHVHKTHMEDVESRSWGAVQKEILTTPKKFGVFRKSVEPEDTDRKIAKFVRNRRQKKEETDEFFVDSKPKSTGTAPPRLHS